MNHRRLRPCAEPYQWHIHGINCFTFPKSLAAGAFSPNFPDRFDAYLYLYNHYDLLNVPYRDEHILPQPFDMHELETFVLRERLGLELAQIRSDPDIGAAVAEALAQEWIPLVPINKRACYYWEGYKRQDQALLLLITGHDEPIDRFTTFDGEQNATALDVMVCRDSEFGATSHRRYTHGRKPDEFRVASTPTELERAVPIRTLLGELYSPYYMTPEVLAESHRSYNDTYRYLAGSFQVLRTTASVEARKRETDRDVLDSIAKEVNEHLDGIEGLLEAKFSALANSRDIPDKQRNRYINSQQILAIALARLAGSCLGEREALDLRDAGLRACELWRRWSVAVALDSLREVGPTASTQRLQDEIKTSEERFLRTIARIPEAQKHSFSAASPLADRMSDLGRRVLAQPAPLSWAQPIGPDAIPLHKGFPFPDLLPGDELCAAMQDALTTEGKTCLGYFGSELAGSLTELLAQRSRDQGVHGQTVVTSGLLQGLHLALQVLVSPVDTIALEAPAYMETLEIVRSYGVPVRAYPIDRDGLLVDRLETDLASGLRIKVLIINPNYQNPSGVTYGHARREHLRRLADQYDFVILEDDAYGEIRFGPAPEPVAKGSERTVYLGSLSKTIAPGIRVGWATGPKAIIEAMSRLARDHRHPLMRASVARYMTSANYETRLERLRTEYRERSDVLNRALEESLSDVPVTWGAPMGGFFLWLHMPGVDTSDLLPNALEEGVAFVPGRTFFYRPDDGANYLRLSFCTATREQLQTGARRLGIALSEALRSE